MTTSMVPVGDPRTVADVSVQYVADKSHAHEGGHRLALDGRTVEVLPGGPTQARNRSHVITRVLHDTEGMPDSTRLETLVGALVLEGATNILIDGTPVVAGRVPIASLRLDVDDDGTISVTSLGGA